MTDQPIAPTALGDVAARQLANATKTTAQLPTISPRWLTHFLEWVPVEAGIFRLNKVKENSTIDVECSGRDERSLPQTFVDYEENPREILLSAVNAVVEVHTRVADLYSVPYNQVAEQLRLTIETIKERQESELINNAEYGLLANSAKGHRVKTRDGRPTLSSSPIRAPSPPLAANAPAAVCRRQPSTSSARPSSPGAAFRWCRLTR